MPGPTPTADRNLIFGLLALHMDFVTREQLLDAMHAWMLDKHTALGDILCRRGILAEDERHVLDLALEKNLKRHGGDHQASLAALRVESGVREDLGRLDDADVQASVATLPPTPVQRDTPPLPRDPSGGSFTSPATVGFTPAPAGVRYRRLRPHARGGLGEVFVAVDEELKREVALKEIQDRFADENESRARFLREAEITGHLEHPSVVPVYGLGVYADGRPYYAMRFIRGESMAAAIERFHRADAQPNRDSGERSLALRELLGRFVAVCQAVGYAHSRGVIHRDLKPSNVMLGEYGETLVVDWGLAKALGQSDSTQTVAERPVPTGPARGLGTEMGQAVGTPAFMPPEQACGRLDQVGPHSDVFALGATLYCLLTGQAPYGGPEAMIQAVMAEVVPARQRKASVPAALEAVCAKAMAARPEDRYLRARALAEDVERWLAGEPVEAWPEPLAVRMGRWVRKHRVLAASTAVALMVTLVLGTAGGVWVQQQKEQERQAQMDRQERAREQAEAGLAQAAKLRDEYHFKAAEKLLKEQVGASVAQAADSTLQDKLAQAERDLKLARDLDEVRQKAATQGQGKWDPNRVAWEYPQVLATHGLDVLKGNLDELVQTIKASAVRANIVAALDDWTSEEGDTQLRGRLLKMANLVDEPDLWRQGVRKALAQGDVRRLPPFLHGTKQGKPTPGVVRLLALAMGENQEAMDLLRQMQWERPQDFWFHCTLGNRFLVLRKYTEAVECYRMAAVLRPDIPVAYNNLGAALADKGKVEEAIAYFRKTIEIDPNWAMAHYNLGVALKAKGKVEEAITCFRQAISLDPKLAVAHINLGVALEDKGKVEEAIACYRQAIAIDPRHALAHTNLGNALKAKGKEEAIACFRKAIALDPKYVLAHTGLGIALYDKGKMEDAMACYRQAIALDPKLAMAHYSLGNALKAKGKVDEAIACFRKALAIDPNDSKVHAKLGNALHENRKVEEAIACYRQAIALDPKFAQAYHNLGNALKAKGEVEEAIASYQKAFDLDPKFAEAHNGLGIILCDVKKDYDGAIACFHKAIALDPKHALAHHNLGVALLAQGKQEEAIDCFRKAIALEPRYAQAHNILGTALLRKGKVEEAIVCYRRALALDPKDASAHDNLGYVLYGKGKVDEAIACYRQAIALDSKRDRAHFNLGLLLASKGKVEEAIACIRKAIELDPKLPPPYFNLGNDFKAKGKVEEAITCFRQAISLDPKLAVAHINLGVALEDKGKVEEAIACYRQAIAIDPRHALAHTNLGNALKAKGKEEAIACFRKAIALDPKFAHAHGALGQTLLQKGRFAEARDASSRALQLLPQGHPLRTGVSRQLEECLRLANMEEKLSPILRGAVTPAGAEECLEVASLCQRKHWHATAARFTLDAFLARAKLADDLQQQHRYNAACSAARAAAGQAEDALLLPDKVALMLRRQALRWLNAELAMWKRQLEQGEAGPSRLARILGHWQKDSDLASLRDLEPLGRLDADERQQWRNFWQEVDALLARTRPGK